MAFNNIFDSSLIDYSKDFELQDIQHWIEEYNKTVPIFTQNKYGLKLNKNVFINDDHTINIGFNEEPTILYINDISFSGFPFKIKEFCNGGIIITGCNNLKNLIGFPDKMINSTLSLNANGLTSLEGFPKEFCIDENLPDKAANRIEIIYNRRLNMKTMDIIKFIKENILLDDVYIDYIINENPIRHNILND